MTKVNTNQSVLYALFGNFFISILKFVGYLVSMSPSLFSEALHSLADTMNQALLWLGVKRSKKKADHEFEYGYAAERFFWAIVSACGIFFLGAGVTIYHGLQSLSGHSSDVNLFVYIILMVSFVIECFTLYKAYQEIYLDTDISFFENLKDSDPISLAVFYEDSVAVFGVFIAFVSITLSQITGNHIYDAVGSIIIGILLGIVAITLLSINRKFLLGKSIPKYLKNEIIELLEADEHIDKVVSFKSEVLDIGKYHIRCEIEFNGYALADDVFKSEDMRDTFDNIRNDYDEFKRFVIYHTNQVPRIVGNVIDKLEKKVKDKYSKIEHIDLEIN